MTRVLDAQAIAEALGKPSGSPDKGFMCLCPAHDDKTPSLSIKDRAGGGVLLRCFANCDSRDVIYALKRMDLWPIRRAKKPSSNDRGGISNSPKPVPIGTLEVKWPVGPNERLVSVHRYHDEAADLIMLIARIEKRDGSKRFLPAIAERRVDGSIQIVHRSLSKPRPIYGLDRLVKNPDRRVLVCEGEKAADAAQALFTDLVCVTWPGGARSAGSVDWRPLKGRNVVLWPDADQPGEKAMDDVQSNLGSIGAATIQRVRLPPLRDGWDLADEAPVGIDVHQLLERAEAVSGFGIRKYINSAKEILALRIPPRAYIFKEWLPIGGLAMIWAERGIGKTWFALSLAVAASKGEDFLAYEIITPVDVLYIDGEMSLAELQDRIRGLCPEPPDRLHILPSESLFLYDQPINLNNEADHQRIFQALDALEREGIRPQLIILDNLSSLTAGADENSNSDLDKLLRFAIQLRHKGITVVFVHHAGKSGDQRGASRREDILDTSIKLNRPKDEDGLEPHDGAHVIMIFVKVRGRLPKPSELELKLVQTCENLTGWSMATVSAVTPALKTLRIIAEKRPKTFKDLVELSDFEKGTISKHWSKLEEQGLITKKPLELTAAGRNRIFNLWPELLRDAELPI